MNTNTMVESAAQRGGWNTSGLDVHFIRVYSQASVSVTELWPSKNLNLGDNHDIACRVFRPKYEYPTSSGQLESGLSSRS